MVLENTEILERVRIMLHLITGGSASGKSNYAEQYVGTLSTKEGRRLYIATMFPYGFNEDGTVKEELDAETALRIQKHQSMRSDRGFTTVECYVDVNQISVSKTDVLLLECMSNLLANERYLPQGRVKASGEDGFKQLQRYVIEPLLGLAEKCKDLVIVTNEIFSDEMNYDEETKYYISLLGQCNQELASNAQNVTEVVCGIPINIKSAQNNK